MFDPAKKICILAAFLAVGISSLCYGEGPMKEDSAKFFPVGIYAVNDTFAFGELKSAGFNTVQTYQRYRDFLKGYCFEAKKNGLKIYVFPPESKKNSSGNWDVLRIKEMAALDVLLAWQLADEPEMNGISPEHVDELRSRIHAEDPSHPAALVIAKEKKYKNYAPVTDVLMVDPYPVPRGMLTKVADAVEKARVAVQNKKPVWAILQLFGYQNDEHKGYDKKREPTIEEVRCMTYLAVAHGAKGIFYFAYHGNQYDVRLSPKYWKGIKRIAGELRDLTPVLLAPVSMEKIQVKVDEGDRAAIHFLIKEFNGKTYLIAVNALNAPLHGVFSGVKGSIQKIGVEFEGRDVDHVDGGFSDDFKPYAAHIYKIES